MKEWIGDNKKNCFGCGACVSVCPRQALAMQPDAEGYLYPHPDPGLCIGCGLCERVCPAKGPHPGTCIDAVAAKAKQEALRMGSTSGGVFPVLAREVLEQGGVVVGAAFDENFQVVHILAENRRDMERIRGSKYVQSRMDGLFPLILERLARQKVLFTGTPCQCDGLRRFIELKHGTMDHLIVCDLICGKVPSPGVWQKYVNYLENRFGGRLTEFVFRSKTAGWQYPYSVVKIDGRDVSRIVEKDGNWMQLFTSPSLCRPACYACPYTTPYRNSDITIGDFWGVEKSLPDFTDHKGISLILAHTQKGMELLDKVKPQLEWRQSRLAHCMQDRLREPAHEPQGRTLFWECYESHGAEGLMAKYGSRTLCMRLIYRDLLPFTRKIGLYDTLLHTYHRLQK